MIHRLIRLAGIALLPLLVVACKNGNDKQNEPPAVRSLLPGQVRNDRETLLMVVGNGFREGATVMLGTTPLQSSTFVNEEMVTAVLPAGLSAGGYPITVNLPGGASAKSPNNLTVLAAAAPPPPPPPTPPPASPTRTATPPSSPGPSTPATPAPTAIRTATATAAPTATTTGTPAPTATRPPVSPAPTATR